MSRKGKWYWMQLNWRTGELEEVEQCDWLSYRPIMLRVHHGPLGFYVYYDKKCYREKALSLLPATAEAWVCELERTAQENRAMLEKIKENVNGRKEGD